jgi:hypothetical protein
MIMAMSFAIHAPVLLSGVDSSVRWIKTTTTKG